MKNQKILRLKAPKRLVLGALLVLLFGCDVAHSDDLAQQLRQAVAAKGPGYRPRTEHLRADGSPVYTNRLIREDSPYLIQHAHNPVNWFPWGEEAFAEAKRLGRPIFLSIGYSTCHWCHVMEVESFEDEDVARFLNEHFVSVKVDREQRPDVDEVYMTALQLMGERGGWPMSSFLTPAGDPFYGGTYFPREPFLDLLGKISNLWDGDRQRILTGASRLAETLRQAMAASEEAALIDEALLTKAVKQTLQAHDENLGGFSGAPKFPSEPELLFLLERVLREDNSRASQALDVTLHHMARGGINDQIAGGFHRYSTDARWLVPHFEKMLYNQAHLARVYLEAWRLTGNVVYERTARQTLDYVLRDMTSPEGGFYSATDADSEGREGEFFVWTPAQLRASLNEKEAELALKVFGVTEKGNFEGKNILHLPKPWTKTADELDMPLDELVIAIDRIRARLYDVRETRIHPLRDEKIVTAWNAMMITTLARAGRDLDDPRYSKAATRAAEFLWRENRRPDGRLWRAYLDGSASVDATLNDYAYLAEAFLTLYDATEEPRWKDRAVATADVMSARFSDPAAGGFFLSEGDHEGRLPARPKSATDGAIPSGNSVSLRALAMLAERTGEARFRRQAEATVAAFSGAIRRQPRAFGYMLLAADELLHGGAGPLDYGGGGAVRAAASIHGESVRVKLDIAEGWHINSNEPLQSDLIATRLEAAGDELQLTDLEYPKATEVHLGFQDEPLAVFLGSLEIRAELAKPAVRKARPNVTRLRLKIQACDEQKCLRPEDLVLEVTSW